MRITELETIERILPKVFTINREFEDGQWKVKICFRNDMMGENMSQQLQDTLFDIHERLRESGRVVYEE